MDPSCHSTRLAIKESKASVKEQGKETTNFFSRGLGLLSQPGPLIHVEAPKSQRLG